MLQWVHFSFFFCGMSFVYMFYIHWYFYPRTWRTAQTSGENECCSEYIDYVCFFELNIVDTFWFGFLLTHNVTYFVVWRGCDCDVIILGSIVVSPVRLRRSTVESRRFSTPILLTGNYTLWVMYDLLGQTKHRPLLILTDQCLRRIYNMELGTLLLVMKINLHVMVH
jgi:hypothetical protein